MTLQQISDRLEIQDLLTRYCQVVDQQNWPALMDLFTHDATVDYSAFGGPRADARTLAEFFAAVLAPVKATQHTISTSVVDLDVNHAHARTAAQVMMISGSESGSEHVAFIGLWYRDQLTRVANEWKIHSRVQEYAWVHNMPGMPDDGAP